MANQALDHQQEVEPVEALGEEATDEAQPEPTAETVGEVEIVERQKPEIEIHAMPEVSHSVRDILVEHTRNVESRELSETVGQVKQQRGMTGMDITLQTYFRNHEELFGGSKIEDLSRSIMLIEHAFLVDIEKQIDENFPDIDPVVREQSLCSIREALYSSVMAGHLTGEKLVELLNGGIVVSPAPGSEIKGEAYKGDIFAFFRFADGKATVYLYDKFLKSSPEVQAHLLRHELAHIIAEAGGIWDIRVINEFEQAANNPTNEAIARFSEYPELAEILKVLQNPQHSSLIWNNYIQNRLQGIEKLPETERGAERMRIGKEMIAEMVAYYLEYGKSEESYLGRRLQFIGNDELEAYILRSCNAENFEELGLNPNMTPAQIMQGLSSRKELSALFASNTAWHKRLSEAFANGGEKLSLRNLPERYEIYMPDDFEAGDEEDEDMMLPDDVTSSTFEGSIAPSKIAQPRPKQQPKIALLTFFELITGGLSSSPNKN